MATYTELLAEIELYATQGYIRDHEKMPTAECLAAAKGFLDTLCHTPGVPRLNTGLSMSTGEIQFFWNCENFYADLEVSPKGVGSFFFKEKLFKTEFFIDDISNEMPRVLNALTSHD